MAPPLAAPFSKPAETRKGHPLRMVGAAQDVTELVEAQRVTAESRTLVEALQECAPIGFALSTVSCA